MKLDVSDFFFDVNNHFFHLTMFEREEQNERRHEYRISALTSPLDNMFWTNSFHEMYPSGPPFPPRWPSRLEVKNVRIIERRKIVRIIRGLNGGRVGGCCCCFGSSLPSKHKDLVDICSPKKCFLYCCWTNSVHSMLFPFQFHLQADSFSDHFSTKTSLRNINWLWKSSSNGDSSYWRHPCWSLIVRWEHVWTIFEMATRGMDNYTESGASITYAIVFDEILDQWCQRTNTDKVRLKKSLRRRQCFQT